MDKRLAQELYPLLPHFDLIEKYIEYRTGELAKLALRAPDLEALYFMQGGAQELNLLKNMKDQIKRIANER